MIDPARTIARPRLAVVALGLLIAGSVSGCQSSNPYARFYQPQGSGSRKGTTEVRLIQTSMSAVGKAPSPNAVCIGRSDFELWNLEQASIDRLVSHAKRVGADVVTYAYEKTDQRTAMVQVSGVQSHYGQAWMSGGQLGPTYSGVTPSASVVPSTVQFYAVTAEFWAKGEMRAD